MITRKPLERHICLRCQQRLSTRRNVRPYSSAPPVVVVEQRVRKQDLVQGEPVWVAGESTEEGTFREKEGQFESDKAGERKLHGYRGLVRREDKEELPGSTTLGDKAKVLMLRDSLFTKYNLDRQRLRNVEPERIDILGRLAKERGLLGDDELMENIEALRPKTESIHNYNELHGLVKKIQKGFTTAQLKKYVATFDTIAQQSPSQGVWKTEDENSNIVRITPWQPGISENTDLFDNDPLRGYDFASYNSKQRLILRLLRQCWMLELPEVSDGLGQFEVEVKGGSLELLLLGQHSAFKRIHSTYLSFEGEKFEAFRQRNTIRVTTTHIKKFAVIDAIIQALKAITTGSVDIRGLLPPTNSRKQRHIFMAMYLNPRVLKHVGVITNTKISQKKATNIQVSSIENDPQAISTGIDAVRRLLLTSTNFSTRVVHQLAIKHDKSVASAGLVPQAFTAGLTWYQKLRPWMRYATPIEKTHITSTSAAATSGPVRPEVSSLPSTQSSTTPVQSKTASPTVSGNTHVHWGERYFTETSALIGNILHSVNSNIGIVNANATPLNQPSAFFNAFSTKLPSLSRLVGEATPGSLQARSRLIVHLLPDPFVKAEKANKKSSKATVPIGINALSELPRVEMNFDIDPKTKEPSIRRINAVVKEHRTDVMIPDNAVDIRFQQTTTSRLDRKHLKPIKDFLAKSRLSLGAQGRLDTPPTIKIPISQHLREDYNLRLPKKKDYKPGDDQEVRYLFAGLEVRKTLRFYWNDFVVLYTSIEAGKAAGSRSELKLRPIKRDGAVAEEGDFVSAAYQLAKLLGGDHTSEELKGVQAVQTIQRGNNGIIQGMRPKPGSLFTFFGGRMGINRDEGFTGDAAAELFKRGSGRDDREVVEDDSMENEDDFADWQDQTPESAQALFKADQDVDSGNTDGLEPGLGAQEQNSQLKNRIEYGNDFGADEILELDSDEGVESEQLKDQEAAGEEFVYEIDDEHMIEAEQDIEEETMGSDYTDEDDNTTPDTDHQKPT